MGEDVENACCFAWKKKYSKLVDKYTKLEELKNKLRDCTSLVNERYGVIEKENISLKQALEELKVQVDGLKMKKEQEYRIRVDLENEVSALKVEIQMLQQNDKSDRQLNKCLNESEKEINHLKELLDKEKCRVDLEKKKANIEGKKAHEALKKLRSEKNKVKEVQRTVDVERKKTDESRLLCEKLKTETDVMKSQLRLEVSKSEAACKKFDDERQNKIKEKERADMAVVKAEEQKKLAETNLSKAVVEKDRANDLAQKMKEEQKRTENLAELYEHVCSKLSIQAQVYLSNSSKYSEPKIDTSLAKKGTLLSQGMENMATKKDSDIIRVKKRADSETRKAKKLRKIAEEHKKKAIEERHRVAQLSRMLESRELRLEELQKMCHTSHRTQIDNIFPHADKPFMRDYCDTPYRYTVKLRKKQLKLEKILVKHAKETAKVEVLRNNILHQELFHLKQRFHLFQLQMDKLNGSFILRGEGTHEMEKVDSRTFTTEKVCCDGRQKHIASGINSRMNHPNRGSNEKLSKSSAINSSSASFSDLPLVGSQESGALSITTSAKLSAEATNLTPTLTRMSDKSIVSYDGHAVSKPDKSDQSFVEGSTIERRSRYHDNKNIFGATKSVGKLWSKDLKFQERSSEKVSVLHDVQRGKNDDPTEQNLRESDCKEMSRSLKRRKTTCKETEIIHSFQSSDEPEVMVHSFIENSSFEIETQPPGLIIIKPDEHLKGLCNNIGSINFNHQDFVEMTKYDHMKLLDLDNAADEESYRRAIAKPLSPTLPDIVFEESEPLEVDIWVDQNSNEGLPNGKEVLSITSEFSIRDMKEDMSLTTENLDVEPVSEPCFSHNHDSHGMLEKPELSVSENEKTHVSCDSEIVPTPLGLPRYFVLPLEHKDKCSMFTILQTISLCTAQCSSSPRQSVDIFLRSILLFLVKTEELSSKDKVCVLLSMVLNEISDKEVQDLPNVLNYDVLQSFDSSTVQMCSALSDLVLRRIFMESCDVLELLVLIENFLLQRKVLVCGVVSSASLVCSSNANFVINGNAVTIYEHAASSYQVLMASCLLASLCSIVDCVDFVCEVSCNMLTIKKFDHAAMLAILHSFVLTCNSKYLTSPNFTLTMTIVKSLVIFLEKEASPTKFSPCKTWSSCTNCPFLDGSISMEDAVLLLLENLQKYGRSTSWSVNLLELKNSLVPPAFSFDATNKDVSVRREAFPSVMISDGNVSELVDILSLVEMIANFMSWEWTFFNIICQLLEFLESCTVEIVYVAILVLLSHLGRLGVNSNGYKDSRIDQLRERLSAFISLETAKTLSIPVQFVTVSSLLGVVPIDFEELTATESTIMSHLIVPVDVIRKWFFLLSKEQQLSFKLYQDSSQAHPGMSFQLQQFKEAGF